mgnify:CR=1 FL=1
MRQRHGWKKLVTASARSYGSPSAGWSSLVRIGWIGSSFYFVFLDSSLTPPVDEDLKRQGVNGELWAVHGGGFYHPFAYVAEAMRMGLTVHPPDVNASDFRCTGRGRELRIGLQFVKGLSAEGAERILACCTHPVFSGPAIERLVRARGWSSFATENAAILNPAHTRSTLIQSLALATRHATDEPYRLGVFQV